MKVSKRNIFFCHVIEKFSVAISRCELSKYKIYDVVNTFLNLLVSTLVTMDKLRVDEILLVREAKTYIILIKLLMVPLSLNAFAKLVSSNRYDTCCTIIILETNENMFSNKEFTNILKILLENDTIDIASGRRQLRESISKMLHKPNIQNDDSKKYIEIVSE